MVERLIVAVSPLLRACFVISALRATTLFVTLSRGSELTLVTVLLPLPTPLFADEPSQPQFDIVLLPSLTPATPPVTFSPPVIVPPLLRQFDILLPSP